MIRRLTTLALVAGAALALFSPSAQAAPETGPKPVDALAACHHADAPTTTAGWVHGKGWVTSPCNQNIDVRIQRWRGAWWETVGDVKSFRAPGSAVASWNCTGAGHYTYRTLIDWRDGQLNPHTLASPEVRIHC